MTIAEITEQLEATLGDLDERLAALQADRDAVAAALAALSGVDPVPPPVVEPKPPTRPSRPSTASRHPGNRPAPGKVTRDQVLDVLRNATGPMSAAEIAGVLDSDTKTVRNRLNYLARVGHVVALGSGQYRILGKQPAPLRSVPDRPETPAPGPGAVPLGGPIARTPFDPDRARRAAGDSV